MKVNWFLRQMELNFWCGLSGPSTPAWCCWIRAVAGSWRLSRPREGREELAVHIALSSTSDQSAASATRHFMPISSLYVQKIRRICQQKTADFKIKFWVSQSLKYFDSNCWVIYSHLTCCLPPCCCSSALRSPSLLHLSARSGNKARHSVSSSSSNTSSGGCLPTDSDVLCLPERGVLLSTS